MRTLYFKTNIKCSGCVAKITQAFHDTVGDSNWSVDLASPDKLLTVNTDLDPDAVERIVRGAGYKAEPVNLPNSADNYREG